MIVRHPTLLYHLAGRMINRLIATSRLSPSSRGFGVAFFIFPEVRSAFPPFVVESAGRSWDLPTPILGKGGGMI
jgi:hypothetical protein